MKRVFLTLLGGAAFFAAGMALTACSGSGSSSSSSSSSVTGGLAPASITSDVYMQPQDSDVRGVITLHADPARTCEFSMGDGQSGLVTLYIGNYRYTKVGADRAEIRMDNLRLNAINYFGGIHATITGYLHFTDESTVVFEGSQTMGGNGTNGNEEGGGEGNTGVNDPFGFQHYVTDANDTTISGGGAKNFSYMYSFEKQQEEEQF